MLHSRIVNGETEFWKSLVRHIKRFEATWVTLRPLEWRKYFIKIGRHFKLKQFYINSTGTLTILCPLMNQGLIFDSFSFDVPLIAPVIASAALCWTDLMTSLDLSDKSSYPKHVSFISWKIEFNPVIIRHMTVSIQLSTVINIFKSTVLKATQEIVEYYLEYRRENYIKPCNF